MSFGDPALGLSGTVSAAQSNSSSDLADAAKSLESVRGDISGQTHAINQMQMSAQQQTQNLQMVVNQLGSQISILSQSLGQMSNSVSMSAAMPPPPGPPMMPMGGGGSGFGQAAAGYGMQGASLAGAGAMAAGRGAGRLGAFAVSPFFGAPIHQSQQGSFGAQLGPDAGFMRGMGLATGIGVQPEMLRTASAAQIHQAGQERMSQRVGDIGMSTLGGAARIGSAFAGEAAGSALMTGMGIGGVGGFFGGMAAGMPIAAGLGAGVDEIAGQAASIRGFGNQFSRNAHKFMPQGGLGFAANRKPGMGQRQEFGKAMNKMSINDLTFNDEDIREIFATMSQQDLMRGVKNTQDLIGKVRDTKEAIKTIGRTMGQTVAEAGETAGIMQSLGFNPTGVSGRSAMFGASSVMGLTPTESMQRSSQFAGQFASQGLGREAFGIGSASLQMGQHAIGSGNIGNRGIAALGGREGVGNTLGRFMTGHLDSSLGQASLMVGDTRGMSAHQIMSQAGRVASGDVNKLINVSSLGATEERAKAMSNPAMALARSMEQTLSIAKTYERGGASKIVALKMAIKENNPEFREATGAQLDGLVELMKNAPEALIAQNKEKGRLLMAQGSNDIAEQTALMSRMKRATKGFFTPAAEGISDSFSEMGSSVGRFAGMVGRGISGTRRVGLGRGLDMDTISGFSRSSSGISAMEKEGNDPGFVTDVMFRNRSRRSQQGINSQSSTAESRKKAAMKVGDKMADPLIAKKVKEITEKIRSPNVSQNQRMVLARELQAMLVGDNPSRDDQNEILTKSGIDIASILGGMSGAADNNGLSKSEKRDVDFWKRGARDAFDLDDDDDVAAFASVEVEDYIAAMKSGSGGAEAKEKLLTRFKGSKGSDMISKITNMRSDVLPFDRDYYDDQLKGRAGRFRELSKKEAGSARIKLAGGSIAGALESRASQFNTNDIRKGMSSQMSAGSMVNAMSRLISRKSDGLVESLESGSESERALGGMISTLRKINLEDGWQTGERELLASRLGIKAEGEQMDAIVKNVTRDSEKGRVLASMFGGSDALNDMNILQSGGKVSIKTNKDLADFAAQTVTLTQAVKDILEMVKDIKKGG